MEKYFQLKGFGGTQRNRFEPVPRDVFGLLDNVFRFGREDKKIPQNFFYV